MVELVTTVHFTCDACQRSERALEQRRTDPSEPQIAPTLPLGWVEQRFGHGRTTHACSLACADKNLGARP